MHLTLRALPVAAGVAILVYGSGFITDHPAVHTEYSSHLSALEGLSVAVAEAMPAEKYDYKPHPESMTFGELMKHITATNFAFCRGLLDQAPIPISNATGKDAIVSELSGSFEFCSRAIDNVTAAQLEAAHNSPDGRLAGRELLLAMFIHVAHHRGQAEIYLRNNGIAPPPYRI